MYIPFVSNFLKNVCLFIYLFMREQVREHKQGDREREKQKGDLWTEQGAWCEA